jgi:plastocyanin
MLSHVLRVINLGILRLFHSFSKRIKVITTVLLSTVYFTAFTFQASAATESPNTLSIKVLDIHNKPLKNMVVFVEPVNHKIDKLNLNTLEIGQSDKSFVPYISVMQLGSDVRFNNKDNITHQIYSPVGKNKFSLKIRSGETFTKSNFEGLGEVSMACNIHDWMSGYLLIVDTPYFSTTDINGNTEIQIDKSGQYKVVVWHPQMNEPENQITQIFNVNASMKINMPLLTPMDEIPTQKNDDDFDFLSDY